ncbi:MAG: Alpha-L-fucosidase [Bacteroidota bacterium]|jgi:alpha-L-fucosidase 2
MKNILILFFIVLHCSLFAQKPMMDNYSNLKLWYERPAEFFEEALPLGNGKIGAMIFGGTSSEKIYLNDITLWSGSPVDPFMNRKAYTFIPEIREAIQNQNFPLADSLIKHIQGKFSESYAPLGTLLIDYKDQKPENYYRDLDLNKSIATVIYDNQDAKISKEYFVSQPDKVIAIRIKSTKSKSLDFSIHTNSQLKSSVRVNNGLLYLEGKAPTKAEPNYYKRRENAILNDESHTTHFTAIVKVIPINGKIIYSDTAIHYSKGSEAIILVSTETSFNGFDKDPVSEGKNDLENCESNIKLASQKSYESLKINHINDYQYFFNRVHFELGSLAGKESISTEKRLIRYMEGKKDPYLEALYFQYGRYLLISSSRTPGVPANLQGLWNPYIQPPWSSNYTVNINVEENYWPSEITNLSEMHLPFLDFISNLSKTGEITAKTFYNAPGWVAHHNSDIWAMTNPVGDFGNGDPVWANWNMGGAWTSTHLWEHYLFTLDEIFLKEKAYPIMKGAAEFCLSTLIKGPNGKLVTMLSTSPENKFLSQDGKRVATSFGSTSDMGMIRELFMDLLEAEKVLGIKNDFSEKISQTLENLHPYQIGKNGSLQEWYYDFEEPEIKHRHQSHLFGLYPGHHINYESLPEIVKASERALEIKGDETTGWSKGWRINLWARIKDGDHAYKMYRELLKYVAPDKMETNYARGGGTYPNLWDAHPPFQIDGNFGGTAAVAEMIVQSNKNSIELLPAIPQEWQNGKMNGLKARGNIELNIQWENGELKNVELISKKLQELTLIYKGTKKKVILEVGKPFIVNDFK